MERTKTIRNICTAAIVCAMLGLCGLTALAVEAEHEEVIPLSTEQTPVADIQSPLNQHETRPEVFPTSVEFIEDEGQRQIIRRYSLSPQQSPSDIPRDSFERDGWLYTLTDITEQRTSVTDTQLFVKTVEFETESNELNEIIALLYPTIEYNSEDGFQGTLNLDITSVSSEVAGHRTSSFKVTATRTYPNLSSNDVSLIPRNITENGRTLTLESVAWEVQSSNNVDFHDIPNSFRAIAQYSANATRSVVTGYITTAQYFGEITRISTGDTVYTAYFFGAEIVAEGQEIYEPISQSEPIPETEPELSECLSEEPQIVEIDRSDESKTLILPILAALTTVSALAGVAIYNTRKRNAKIYEGDFRTLVAKDRINSKNKKINLTPLQGAHFGIEIEKSAAKCLNGQTLDICHGASSVNHKIAYEGNVYRFKVDFTSNTTQAIHN